MAIKKVPFAETYVEVESFEDLIEEDGKPNSIITVNSPRGGYIYFENKAELKEFCEALGAYGHTIDTED